MNADDADYYWNLANQLWSLDTDDQLLLEDDKRRATPNPFTIAEVEINNEKFVVVSQQDVIAVLS